MDGGQFEEFQKLTTAGISVGLPYADYTAFFESPYAQLLILNPILKANIEHSNIGRLAGWWGTNLHF